MQVQNMTSNKGNKIANQFVIKTDDATYFQSYNSIIAKVTNDHFIYLDETYWNWSRTTSKYRSIFLNESTEETKRKIAAGHYMLTNLNN
jgi:ribonuclease HII